MASTTLSEHGLWFKIPTLKGTWERKGSKIKLFLMNSQATFSKEVVYLHDHPLVHPISSLLSKPHPNSLLSSFMKGNLILSGMYSLSPRPKSGFECNRCEKRYQFGETDRLMGLYTCTKFSTQATSKTINLSSDCVRHCAPRYERSKLKP